MQHTGGPLGVYMRHTAYGNNVVDGSLGAPRFKLSFAAPARPVHERYGYDTSDRRVVKEVDANGDHDFTDAEDVSEGFVYDGDAIALVFDGNTPKNRYLHGPGVDEALAEEGNHVVALASTTVTLSDFASGGIDGAHTLALREDMGGPGYWYGTWATGEMSLMPTYGGVGWDAYVYSYDDGNTISFHNNSSSTTPPMSGWAYAYDDYGQEAGAGVSIGASTTTAWNTHWLLGDHQGSVRTVIDDQRKVQYRMEYDAFGNLAGTNATTGEQTRFGFAGEQYDRGTGLIYHGQVRYTDPQSATHLQPDLAVEAGGDINARRVNRNNSVDNVDPFGWVVGGGGGSNHDIPSFSFNPSTSYDEPFSLAPSPYASPTTRPATMPSTMPVAPAMAPVDFSTSYLQLENSSSPELRALAARYKTVMAAAMNENASDALARAEYKRSGPSMRPMTAAESRRANNWVAQQREWQDLDLAVRGPYHEAEANALRGDAFVKGDSQVMFDVAVDVTNAFGGQMRSGGGAQSIARRGGARTPRGGWNVGQPITNNTAAGNVPSWSAVRTRYWKNEAHYNAANYSADNLARIKQGNAPQRINPNTGQVESKELHHAPPQREGGLFEFRQVWPEEHGRVDPFRRTGN
ncbi:MAG: RHS repeat-associated core domain-containing protein [Tepidisphaeraceae bacterium]